MASAHDVGQVSFEPIDSAMDLGELGERPAKLAVGALDLETRWGELGSSRGCPALLYPESARLPASAPAEGTASAEGSGASVPELSAPDWCRDRLDWPDRGSLGLASQEKCLASREEAGIRLAQE
jgi:hypothetical protein